MNGATRLAALLGTWGKPEGRPALWALCISGLLVALALAPSRFRDALGLPSQLPEKAEWRRRIVAVLGFVAAFLSLGYVAYYLRAGPRIIDATSYFLEGRVLSHGHFAWTVPTPSASFRGRFLLFRELAGATDARSAGKLAVIFPPGFPLLLAGGFLVGAPLVVGPLIAGGLVAATYWLAIELTDHSPSRDAQRQGIAVLAAMLSVVCAALRYHTADTMAHGASALGITIALAAALHGQRAAGRAAWLLAGLGVGWVVATRPVSAVPIAAVVLSLAWCRGRVGAYLLGGVPGVALLLAASHAQTGSWLASAQAAYYAVSDGPPGCFRYGFGSGVGCLEEHKDFVLARLPHGYGLVEAALTTLRRLRIHLLDVANFEPLALLVLVPLMRLASERDTSEIRRCRVAFLVVVGQMLAYVPFYFDGDYPGGGARFYADVLPIEHALLAIGVASLLPSVPLFRRGASVLGVALAGFAVHGAFEHKALADRDGGHPMYDPDEGRNVGKGVMFFDTDHGFDLAYDPYVDLAHGFLAARFRGDDHDRLLVDRLDHPPAHVYKRDARKSVLSVWTAKPGGTKDLWRFEAEADWPPLAQEHGWIEPVWASNSCASDGRVVTLHTLADARTTPATATFELPVPRTGKWSVTPRIMRRGGRGHGKLVLVPEGRATTEDDAKLVWEWNDDEAGAAPGHDVCTDLPTLETTRGVLLEATGAHWVLTAIGGDVSLDQTTLRAAR